MSRTCTVPPIACISLQYLVNDRMLARCGAQIRVEVIDRATGRLCDSDLSDVFLEVRVGGLTQQQTKRRVCKAFALTEVTCVWGAGVGGSTPASAKKRHTPLPRIPLLRLCKAVTLCRGSMGVQEQGV